MVFRVELLIVRNLLLVLSCVQSHNTPLFLPLPILLLVLRSLKTCGFISAPWCISVWTLWVANNQNPNSGWLEQWRIYGLIKAEKSRVKVRLQVKFENLPVLFCFILFSSFVFHPLLDRLFTLIIPRQVLAGPPALHFFLFYHFSLKIFRIEIHSD